jgi:lipopolysaccharide biosynthesis regulator YciM
MRKTVIAMVWLAMHLLGNAVHAQEQRRLVPGTFSLDEAAQGALDAAWLTEDERKVMRVFHGVWDERDLTTPTLKARAALNAWEFTNPALDDPSVPVEIRAEAKLHAGEIEQALEILKDARSLHAARIRAEANETLGRLTAANEAIHDAVKRLQQARITDPDELTEGVRAMFIRARIQGQPARDFQSMMDLLGRARQELDRLHWPSRLAEAELLLDKDNFQEAVAALHETLGLNPRCAPAWFMLGEAAIARFDFAGGSTAAAALRRLNRAHPLADLLEAQSQLTQDNPQGAMEILQPLLKRLPKLRSALALHAAARAISYDDEAMKAALDRYDQLSPSSALAYYEAGRFLSLNRQYGTAATVLEEAIRRQPAWAAPQIELGLMELQSGRDDRALRILQDVIKLDQFNKRAVNSHFLLEELTKYAEIESEHFIVRYLPGEDQALAEMMLGTLEEIHTLVAGRFQFEPRQKTLIELHPNHNRFAVRITGMPFVHTIAACTGPVIAMEVPREGPKHLGLFDWPRVIQHEYTHTITLAQTQNRIPHWLTEAAAVSMEPGPRAYDTCLMLAKAYRDKTLFSFDELKWAFVRPRLPGDRGKAYAQGFWMVEYMNHRFGESALVRLLDQYYHGQREQQAIPAALGISREQFFIEFLEWAEDQVQAWGLAATPSIEELSDQLRTENPDLTLVMEASQQARMDAILKRLTDDVGAPGSGTGGLPERREGVSRQGELTADQWPPLVRPPVEITDEQLATWMDEYPDHPDLLELHLRRRIERLGEEISANDEALIQLLERYAVMRPVDPYPHKKLAQIWLSSDRPEKAIPHLEFLDVREEKSPVYALQLARLYRQQSDLESALAKITRGVNINPYHAANREFAATIAMEAKQYPVARQHIVALTLLEPDRPQHQKRLEAIDKMLAK